MIKLIKNVTIVTIAATILGSIIPMKSHAEEISKPSNEKTINQVSTQSSLTAPSIIQGRAVNTKYTQMPMPTVEAYSNEDGTGTGYLDISWEPIEGITKYQIILFNGSVHSYWDVPADQTTWTTKDKGMFPTSEQIEVGQVNFRRDGKGTDFVADPSILYKKAFEINGGLNYSDSSEYYVRVTAVHEDGASPISFAANTVIPFYDHNQEDENVDIVSNNLDFAQTNRLLNLGFTDSEIESMTNEEYEINKDLQGEVISSKTNYIKIIEPRETIAYSISNNEPIIIELDEETYYDEINKLNDNLNSRASSDFSTTSYKKMTTTITKLSSKEYRLKNSVVWSKLPSQRYVDVIGIGINSSFWAPNPGTQYGQQNWTTKPTIGNPSKSKSAKYTKDSNNWKKGAGGYALKINLPDNKAKGIDSEYLKTLSSYMYYSVGSLTNTRRLDAYGNYAHQNSSYTLTPSIALSGISFSVSPVKKFSFHPDTHASITW